jgi:hypothetical protein
MNGAGALFCSFGDVAAGLAGLAWDLGEPGALLLSDGEARPATFALEEGGDAATLALTAQGSSAEATLAPRTAALRLAGEVAGPTLVACEAEVRSAGGKRTLACAGQIGRWAADPTDGAAVFRQLVVEAADGALLAITSVGPPGVAGHGEASTAGWQLQDEDIAPFDEALLSTQYDAAGEPTRFGLELWPEEAERATRAAAVRVSATVLGGVRVGATWAGVFRCRADGHEGLGSYLLWTA